jgi:small subunit ribosomal protein S21
MARAINVIVESENPHRDDTDYLIKKFIKEVKKSGLIQDIKNRQYYEKPSVTRRRKKKNKLKKSREITAKKHKSQTIYKKRR